MAKAKKKPSTDEQMVGEMIAPPPPGGPHAETRFCVWWNQLDEWFTDGDDYYANLSMATTEAQRICDEDGLCACVIKVELPGVE